jgi:hypothetical protein
MDAPFVFLTGIITVLHQFTQCEKIRSYAVQGKIGGVWVGFANFACPNTPILPPTA